VRSTPEEIIGKTDEIFVPPELAAEFRASDDAVLEAGKILQKYETMGIGKDGKPTWELTTKAPLRDMQGNIIGIVGISRDITELKQAEMLEQEQRALAEALRDTAEALNASLDFEETLDCILRCAERIVPHDNANILMIEGDVARIVRPRDYREGASQQQLGDKVVIVAETGSLREMIASKEALIIPDVNQYPAWKHWAERPWVRSYIGLPLQIEGEVIGFLNLLSGTVNAFGPQLLGRLQAFSSQISLALLNARLYQQAEELAAIKERHWLANELHDAVSQSLFAIRLVAGGLPHVAQDLPASIRESLNELDQLSHRAHSEMRSLLLELRPAALEQSPLNDLLVQLVETFQSRNKCRVTTQLTEGIVLPPEVQITFYRIAQEAFNNIVKHAQAQEVNVLLQKREGIVELMIRDDGRGFDPAALPVNHFGVGIMHERAAAVDAGLQVLSQPGQGTSIMITWPAPG
jgi:signal transduction histidine kinase